MTIKRARDINSKGQTGEFIELLHSDTWGVYHIGNAKKRQIFMRSIILIERTAKSSDAFSNLEALAHYTYVVEKLMEGQGGKPYKVGVFNEPPTAPDGEHAEYIEFYESYWNSIYDVVNCFRTRGDLNPEMFKIFEGAVPPQTIEDWTILTPISNEGGRIIMDTCRLLERRVGPPDMPLSKHYIKKAMKKSIAFRLSLKVPPQPKQHGDGRHLPVTAYWE